MILMANEQSERAQQQAQRKEAERIEGLVRAGVSDCLNTTQGRALLWRLLQIGRIDENPYRHNALDTAFNCGEVNIGLQIKAMIFEVNPDGFINMMKESEANARSRADSASNPPDADSADPGSDD